MYNLKLFTPSGVVRWQLFNTGARPKAAPKFNRVWAWVNASIPVSVPLFVLRAVNCTFMLCHFLIS